MEEEEEEEEEERHWRRRRGIQSFLRGGRWECVPHGSAGSQVARRRRGSLQCARTSSCECPSFECPRPRCVSLCAFTVPPDPTHTLD